MSSSQVAEDRSQTRLPDPTEVEDGRFAKSRITRTRIMEAAMQCLAERGYASLSTAEVASEADLTRAAVLYHFPSRAVLIEATVYYVTRKRVEMYGEVMAEIATNDDFFDIAIDVAWQQTQTTEFRAFKELSTAARTDLDLAAVFTPALIEYDRARRAMALKLFPRTIVKEPWFDLGRDLVRFLLEGLADEGDAFAFDGKRRHEHIIAFLKLLRSHPAGGALLEAAVSKQGKSKRAPR